MPALWQGRSSASDSSKGHGLQYRLFRESGTGLRPSPLGQAWAGSLLDFGAGRLADG